VIPVSLQVDDDATATEMPADVVLLACRRRVAAWTAVETPVTVKRK
jgi:hypothetical protein